MKTHAAHERALKTAIQFHKAITGEIAVSSDLFTGAISQVMHHFAGEDGCFLVADNGERGLEFIINPATNIEKYVIANKADLFRKLFDDGKNRIFNKNDGDVISKKNRSWMFIPVASKKGVLCAFVIVREHGKFAEEEETAARDLGTYFAQFLRDLRLRNRKINSLADETRHRMLLRTQSSLDRRQADFPGFKRGVDYSACTGSDMGQMYRIGEDAMLACVCDLTADDQDRQSGLIYLDTWFSILAQTSLGIGGMLARLNADMAKRTSECYASIALVRYSKKTGQAEIGGSGSAIICHFSHETMTARIYEFGMATGVTGDAEPVAHAIATKSGDIIALCTDGLAGMRRSGGDLFGTEAIGELVRRNYFLSADDLVKKVLASVAEASEKGVNTDDRTIQILKID
jgi:hypothetical protein